MCNLIYSQKKTKENYSEVAFFTPPSGKDEKGYQRLLEKEAGAAPLTGWRAAWH